jgi:hypothetical protein
MCESAALLLLLLLLLWLAALTAAHAVLAAVAPEVLDLAALFLASASATSFVAVRLAAQKVKKYSEPACTQQAAALQV